MMNMMLWVLGPVLVLGLGGSLLLLIDCVQTRISIARGLLIVRL